MDKLKEILEDKIVSRINSYVYLKKLNTEIKLDKIEDIIYLNFERESEVFFKKNNLTLNVFDRGKFFEYIKEKAEKNIVLVDNLEIIQNILYKKETYEDFFKEMQLHKFKNKVIFVFSNIKKMKIKRILKNYYIEKNIILGENNEN